LGLGRKKARIGINSEDQSNDSPGDIAAPAPEKAQESMWAGSEKKRHCGDNLDLMHEDLATPQTAARPAPDKAKERRPAKERPAAPRPKEAEEAPALDFSHLPPPPTQPAPGETVVEGEADAVMAEARVTLANILEKMGFSTEISTLRIAGRLILKLADSDDNALLIGSRGSTLEAMELLLGRILIKKLKAAENPEAADLKVIVDVADYRARRQAAILDSLRNIAAQVRRSRKPQAMNGLSAAERRLIQLALRPARDLSSRNDAPRDSVVIAPYHSKEKRH
jgi:predicted RNA-binding protein Jag